MGAFIAGFTMNRGQFLAAGFHGLMELRLIGSARAPMEPYGNPHRPPKALSSYCSGLGQSDSRKVPPALCPPPLAIMPLPLTVSLHQASRS